MNFIEEDFLSRLTDKDIVYTLALTGSTARGEARKNTSRHDYTSDIDVLCLIDPKDIPQTLCCKNAYEKCSSLILMSSEALKHPSNAILSMELDWFGDNGLLLQKPDFSGHRADEFLAYQTQPLAYYNAQLTNSTAHVARRLYSKICITCLKLLYLSEYPERRRFVFEHELIPHRFPEVSTALVEHIVNRDLPDDQLESVAQHLKNLITQHRLITESATFLDSTALYFSSEDQQADKIIQAVFLENNKLSKPESLFLRAH
ncbi:nucleotidyltransferase domain-containing protein [Pseudomonas fluorescens]|jgi:predicted nucleotidyltransferase|uniref:Uncharacterized protein n=1 Tax=Pseudomonas fluorescens TaxID=294 RepID=A0A2N1E924_PSEFL|nr:nucleotidyltransferase domain-containing protein [Pseudomonas fluorescens]PKH22862.1 hypothetical protein CIB54_08510 [Pseudomonas fluorescens]